MRGGVPEGLLAVLVVKGEQLHLGVGGDGSAQVADLAVDNGGTAVLVQTHGNGFGYLGGSDVLFKFLYCSAFEFDVDHKYFSFC